MKEEDYIQFKILLIKALKKAFVKIVNHHKIYAFGVYSSEFTDSIICVVNTLEYLDSKRKKNKYSIGYKFLISEWNYDIDTNNNEFKQLNKFLYQEIFIEKSKEEHLLFEKKIYQICFESLKKLKEEGFFKQNFNGDLFIVFEPGDDSFGFDKLIENAKILNNNKYGVEYTTWLESLIKQNN